MYNYPSLCPNHLDNRGHISYSLLYFIGDRQPPTRLTHPNRGSAVPPLWCLKDVRVLLQSPMSRRSRPSHTTTQIFKAALAAVPPHPHARESYLAAACHLKRTINNPFLTRRTWALQIPLPCAASCWHAPQYQHTCHSRRVLISS